MAVEVNEQAGGVCLLLNGAGLASWPALLVRGVARLLVGEQARPDGVVVRVVALDAGGLVSVLMGGRFLFSLELEPDGGLYAASVARGEPGRGPTTG